MRNSLPDNAPVSILSNLQKRIVFNGENTGLKSTLSFDFWNSAAIATYIYRTAGFQTDAAFLKGILSSKLDGALVSVSSRRICRN